MDIKIEETNPVDFDSNKNKFYLSTWRWHFYSGLYVIPFMLMLAVTGLLIMFAPFLEGFLYADKFFVTHSSTMKVRPYEEQLKAVQNTYPKATLQRFRPNNTTNGSSSVGVATEDERELTVYVNPYTLQVLGELDNSTRIGSVSERIHGTLLMGDWGDYLIEIAAGLGVLLVISGLYLWWPRGTNKLAGVLWPRFSAGKRTMWKDLHSVPAFYTSAGLLFFFISGLAWTGVWGGKIVQPWNTYPEQMWNDVPKSGQTMESINREGEKIVPWNLEKSALPVSGSAFGAEGIPAGTPVNLDSVIRFVRANGVDHGFWVALPTTKEGVWTVSASAMSGDVADARKDLTLHIDQYSGKVLANIGWQQYSLGAKAMAAGIALHQGGLGSWNMVLNTLFCLTVILFCVAAVIMWWLRRPAGVARLVAPPIPSNWPAWKGAAVLFLALGVLFPLSGAVMLVLVLLDFLLIARIPALKRMFN